MVKISSRIKIQIAAISLLLPAFIISDAYAYLDPGSGSIVIQSIIGALVGVGIAIKVYWEKVKMKFYSIRK
ncbi:MAG: hypothetical protein OEQ94_01385 [Nitrosopumilus sp.]|nr:hypothetical protein [Nitrosopumilus sp.]MDH3832642.1 hypothetical protein [Nitrosopumilus sp.]